MQVGNSKTLGRLLGQAAIDGDFRRRFLDSMGTAIAEEGYVLTDTEMNVLREFWSELNELSPVAAYERIQAKARTLGRL